MKKLIICTLALFLVAGCGGKIKSYEEISYQEYTKKVEKKENFILYIGSDTCSHCQEFTPTLKKVIKKHQIDIKYINISNLSTNEYAILRNKTKVQGTPTIVFFHNGVVDSGNANKIQGSVSMSEVEKVLKRKGYIK